jgi:hypothetical protein
MSLYENQTHCFLLTPDREDLYVAKGLDGQTIVALWTGVDIPTNLNHIFLRA